MAIVHVALWARDLDGVCAFYESLGATRGSRYENPTRGFSSFFLSWPGSQVRLEVMHQAELARHPKDSHLGLSHIAVGLGSEEAVNTMASVLRARGVPVLDGPRRTGDGYYECVVSDPEGNRVELTV